jgi:hypothetical protein
MTKLLKNSISPACGLGDLNMTNKINKTYKTNKQPFFIDKC